MSTWGPDSLLAGFESMTLNLPDDYEGPLVATLVRRKAAARARKAVLYVHGFVDYFFQAHLAEQYIEHGFNFYALDLRKYGRSLRADQHPNFCKDIEEYFDEISAAISTVTDDQTEGNNYLVLSGHSTGGLTVSLYAHCGALKTRINALTLNSPFFEFNASGMDKAILALATRVGRLAPYLPINRAIASAYGQSLHRDYHGEWSYDTRFKPITGFPIYFGWIRAIRIAHARVRAGLDIACPVLLMRSDHSVFGRQWTSDFQAGDAVLNVAHMRAAAKRLGPNVTELEIADGLHDLTLSRADVRERLFQELFRWHAT